MPVKSHIHKYILRNLGSREKPRKVYSCAFSDCSHFMPSKQLLIGKKAICWGCEKEFTINRQLIDQDRKKLKCQSCRRKFHSKGREEEVKQAETLDSAIDRLFSNMRDEG